MTQVIDKSRIAKNTIFLYIRMFVIMLVTLYTSRVILKTLGVEDYGVYNVVAGSVALFGFMNSAMSMATQRFLNFYMVKGDANILRRVFAMSLNIHVIIAVLVIILCETLGLWILNTQLNIPPDRMIAARWVYQFAIITFCISIIQVPFNSAILAHEKMNIYAVVSIVEVFLKLGVVFILSAVAVDKLLLYGALLLMVGFAIFIVYTSISYRLFKECRYKLCWDKKLFKEIAGFSGWNIFGQVAQVLTTQGVNMVANVFCGVIVNASIGITNQVSAAMSQFTSNFQTAFRPQIVKSYSAGDMSGMQKLTCQASKFSFFLLYIISVPIIFNIDSILDLWLDTVPQYSALFCKILIWYSYFEVIGMPLVISIMATGRNRNYQMLVSITIALNFILSLLFLKKGFPPEIIFYIKVIISFFVLAVRLFYAKRQASFSVGYFLKSVMLPVCIVAVIISLLQVALYEYMESWTSRILITFIIETILMAIIYFVGFSKNERQTVVSMIHKKIKR